MFRLPAISFAVDVLEGFPQRPMLEACPDRAETRQGLQATFFRTRGPRWIGVGPK